MIKKIKNFICKIFGIKQCECPEDEHIELYTEAPEPKGLIYTDVDGKAVKCGKLY
jgi:hypothetical protein